jgi:DNA-binding PadR family transcriptional regulator
MNANLLKIAVLDVLSDLDEAVTERMILLALSAVLGIRATYGDLGSALRKLEEDRCVIGLTGENGSVKWRISDNGRARLAEVRKQ